MSEPETPNLAGMVSALVCTLIGWGPIFYPVISDSKGAIVIAVLWASIAGFWWGPAAGFLLITKIFREEHLRIPAYFPRVLAGGGYAFLFLLGLAAILFLLK